LFLNVNSVAVDDRFPVRKDDAWTAQSRDDIDGWTRTTDRQFENVGRADLAPPPFEIDPLLRIARGYLSRDDRKTGFRFEVVSDHRGHRYTELLGDRIGRGNRRRKDREDGRYCRGRSAG